MESPFNLFGRKLRLYERFLLIQCDETIAILVRLLEFRLAVYCTFVIGLTIAGELRIR